MLGSTALMKRVTGTREAKNVTNNAQTTEKNAMQIDESTAQTTKNVNSDVIDPNDPYEKIRIDQNKNEDDIVCDVCLDDDDDEGNEIVICDLCLGAVHQSCYGSELLGGVPEGNWYCARCRDLLANPSKKCTEINCSFCPKIDGILKPIDTGAKGGK